MHVLRALSPLFNAGDWEAVNSHRLALTDEACGVVHA